MTILVIEKVISKFLFLALGFLIVLNRSTVSSNAGSGIHRRFEYKYSFKPPYLAQKDGTVPFWAYGGNAIASSESVRVAPSLRSQKGAIWTKTRTNFDWWEVEISFRITGRNRVGADGLAFWYTENQGDYNGPVFGSSDRWNGVGIFFDSFDNDNKHNNPYIMAVLNDGTKSFDHQNDGTTQLLSGCLRDFRNKPFPTRAKIEYYNNILTVLFHNGMTNNNDDYELCLRADGVHLPKNGFFGLSAATGGLADDHDVFHFLTTSLHPPGALADSPNRVGEDSEKLAREYQEYQSKLEKQKEEYRREHPDEHKDEEFDEWFESDNQRELRQIFQVQSHISDSVKDLSRKMDEVIGRQERTLGLLSAQPQIQGQQVAGGGPITVTGTITRSEVDIVINNINVLINDIRDVKNVLNDVSSRTNSILQNQARAPTAQVQAGGAYDMQSIIHEMRDGLNQVKNEMQQVGHKFSQPSAQIGCPTQNCVGVTMFLATTIVNLIIILSYQFYKSRSETQAKKFY
ncbi:protein ERGIC-53 [Condylostylus longicornis]|uniref:protein ERGIC-53 n=1 Tax=Condylostylus longicornis TaxID=2530218 RepID=UPI00244E1E4C|nr:protein ERGIC-53 [Condylostylus longicornis]